MVRQCSYKFLTLALFLTFMTFYAAFASAISFQLVQHDSGQEKIRSSSYVIEGVLFDYFFDAGHIATNIPTVISSSEADDEDLFFAALSDTKNGFCNYLIMIHVEYDSTASSNPEAVLLSNIRKVNWLVYDATSESLLEQGERSVGVVPDKANNIGGVKDLAKKLAMDINAVVRKR